MRDRPYIARFERQSVLSAPKPKRAEVLQFQIQDSIQISGTLAVWRNHAIEPILPLLDVFLRHSGFLLQPSLGSYDDTLSLSPPPGSIVDLIWFDLDRLEIQNDALDWFTSRLELVAESASGRTIAVPVSTNPDLTAAVADRFSASNGVLCADPWPICEQYGVPLVDERYSAFAGTRISRPAQMQIARFLGTHWLPAAVLPQRKLIAVDLDETLHKGVLGEDGIEGIVVTPAHRRLHDYLKGLAEDGTMLALISRNEQEDVERLFSKRWADYGLTLDDFAEIAVSWGSKSDAIRRVAASLSIGEDSIVFVDDNIGELLSVSLDCPAVAPILAKQNADSSIDAIRWQTGLWRWSADQSAHLRVRDLRGNQERQKIRNQTRDIHRYLEELGVEVEIGVNPQDQMGRLSELSLKTNQFNLSLLRMSPLELQRSMREQDSCVVSIHLKDRISESGIIGLVVAQRDSDRLWLEELAISCRALGRGLETIVISQALRAMPWWEQVSEVAFRVRRTERNLPARQWLASLIELDEPLELPEIVRLSADLIDSINPPPSVRISLRNSQTNPD